MSAPGSKKKRISNANNSRIRKFSLLQIVIKVNLFKVKRAMSVFSDKDTGQGDYVVDYQSYRGISTDIVLKWSG